MLLDLGLEFFLEAAAHPLAPLGLDFQFQFTQRITSACIRVHLLAFRLGCSHSEKEPIFPVSIMAVVSSSAPPLFPRKWCVDTLSRFWCYHRPALGKIYVRSH